MLAKAKPKRRAIDIVIANGFMAKDSSLSLFLSLTLALFLLTPLPTRAKHPLAIWKSFERQVYRFPWTIPTCYCI
jgi:hypothetical protein